jgi:hypothetical protein
LGHFECAPRELLTGNAHVVLANQRREPHCLPLPSGDFAYKMFSSDPEYDTDAISLTSTVKSDNDNIYDIKCILSEGLDQSTGKDVMKFLIEWEGYPMHE